MDRVVQGNIRNGKIAIGNWGWDIKNVLTEQGSPPVDVFIASLGVRRGSKNLTWILIFYRAGAKILLRFWPELFLGFLFCFWEKGQILTWILITAALCKILWLDDPVGIFSSQAISWVACGLFFIFSSKLIEIEDKIWLNISLCIRRNVSPLIFYWRWTWCRRWWNKMDISR